MSRIDLYLLSISLAAVVACSEKAEFRLFTTEEGRFEVMFPEAPKHTFSNLEVKPNGEVNVANAYFASGGGLRCGVLYVDFPEKYRDLLKTERPNLRLEPYRTAIIERNGLILQTVSNDEIRVSENEIAYGERFIAGHTSGRGTIYARFLMLNNRAYLAMATLPIKHSKQQEAYAYQFLSTFKIKQ